MPPKRLPEHFHWLMVQRKCKSNAEYQACLNILLRCSFSSAKIQQKATFCNSLFGLRAKSVHVFNIYTENQVVTKPYNISNLKRERVSFLSKSFLSFSKSKMTKMTLTKMTRLADDDNKIKYLTFLSANPLPKSKEIKKRRKLFLPLRYAMMIAAPG